MWKHVFLYFIKNCPFHRQVRAFLVERHIPSTFTRLSKHGGDRKDRTSVSKLAKVVSSAGFACSLTPELPWIGTSSSSIAKIARLAVGVILLALPTLVKPLSLSDSNQLNSKASKAFRLRVNNFANRYQSLPISRLTWRDRNTTNSQYGVIYVLKAQFLFQVLLIP